MSIIKFPKDNKNNKYYQPDQVIRNFERAGRLNSIYEYLCKAYMLAFEEGSALYAEKKVNEVTFFYAMQETTKAFADMVHEMMYVEDIDILYDPEKEGK